MLTLYHNNDNVIELSSLKNAITGSYINDATVEVTLTDLNNVELSGETWPKAMAATGSNGTYRATLTGDLATSGLDQCRALIQVSGSYIAEWEAVVDIRRRR